MKKLLMGTLVFLALKSNAQFSQAAKVDASGNYTAVAGTRDTALNLTNDKLTGKTFTTSKGENFPVYISKNGKLFVVRVGKESGKRYKQYLKLD
jgi:hypothetical protein